MFNTICAALAILTLTLAPRKLTEPGIAKQEHGLFVFQNPRHYPVSLTLNCGMDWEPIVVCLDPGATILRIVEPDGLTATCTASSWVRASSAGPCH
jgi:hypothetical protein